MEKLESLQLTLTKWIQATAMNSATDMAIQGFAASVCNYVCLNSRLFIIFDAIQYQGRARQMRDLGKAVGRRLLSFAKSLHHLLPFLPLCYLIPLECSSSHKAPIW